MKIAVNSRLYEKLGGGISYYTKLLYQQIIASNKSEKVIFLQPGNRKTFGITKNLQPFSIGKILWIFDLIWVHFMLLNEKDVDIFHGAGNVIPVVKKRSVKYVVTIHDVAFKLFPQHNSRLLNLYYEWGVSMSVRNADAIIVVSECTKRDLMRLYRAPEKKIKVIRLGVNDLFMNPPKAVDRQVDGQYLLSVTTHPKRKNIPNVLKALALQPNWFKNFTYVIAGVIAVDQKKELLALIKELGLANRVRLLGYVTEIQLYSLYANAEFFIYPSIYEGFGIPVLEAMVCHCPVITSNTSALIEIMPDPEWLVEPQDVKSISQKMEQIMALSKSERRKLVDMNYQFASQFTWERAASQTQEVFNQILNSAK